MPHYWYIAEVVLILIPVLVLVHFVDSKSSFNPWLIFILTMVIANFVVPIVNSLFFVKWDFFALFRDSSVQGLFDGLRRLLNSNGFRIFIVLLIVALCNFFARDKSTDENTKM